MTRNTAITFLAILAGALAVALFATFARAQDRQQVDVALVLAIDESGSINPEEWQLQMQGYAAAFRDQGVLWAINGGHRQRIALVAYTWSQDTSRVIVPWRIVTMGDSEAIASAFERTPYHTPADPTGMRFTDLSHAFGEAVRHFSLLPFEAQRLVLDISGDGKHNTGPDFAAIRQSLIDAGVVINGLPIVGTEEDVDVFYRDQVIGGPGAFMVAAGGFEHFAGAIQMKLMTEIGMME